METKTTDAEGEAQFKKSEARSRVAAEKFVAGLPRTGQSELDIVIVEVAKKAYLIGRNELGLEIMKAL